MKKVFVIRLISLFGLLVSLPIYAYDFESGGIYYIIDGDNVSVTSGDSKYQGEVIIPSQVAYNGKTYSVSSIGESAFQYCSDLTSISIPSSVISIGSYAFRGCSGLTSVTIPNSVTSIGSNAFEQCNGLTSVTIPNSVEIISSGAFELCTGLTSVIIPSSVISIGDNAFLNCYDLTSVTIPNGVRVISSGAFRNCIGLTSVALPSSLTNIERDAFFECIDLESIIVESGNRRYDSRNDCNAIIETSSNKLIIGCRCTVIPNDVTSIGSNAFEGCSGLKSITIPNSVTSIGDEAFKDCKGLASITFSNSLIEISSFAFKGTAWYDNQPDGLVYAGSVAYEYRGEMPSDTHISLKEGTLGIAEFAFSGCGSLASISIPNSVAFIGSEAFSYCHGLTSINIPNSVTSIGEWAFGDCYNLTSIKVERGNEVYDSRNDCNAIIETSSNTLIVGCAKTIIPNNVTSIGMEAFRNCSGLTSITIPNSVTSIGWGAFLACSGLTSVIIPNSVTSISGCTFSDCSGLTSVTIPNSVTSIGESAFFDCSGLTSVTIPEGVTSIGDYTFFDCSSLTSVTIPNSVTSIGGSAFERCRSLRAIIIPNSVISIGDKAFDDTSWFDHQYEGLIYIGMIAYKFKGEMPNNTHITLKEGTTKITNSAFNGCSGLASITIPNGVTSIGNSAFYGCSGLTSVTIPNSVTSIGSSAFYGTAWYDNQQEGLVYAGKVAYKYKGEIPADTHIAIKDGTLGIAGSAFAYCRGLISVTIPNSVTSIGSHAFQYCSGLTSVTIPNSVTSIGSYAFQGCSGLTSVTIPNSVTSICDDAFVGCKNLTFVNIPNSVTSIGNYAFYWCNGLTTITSEIEKPFEISGWTFSDDTYNVAELIVPYGTKAAYQDTEGWNKFSKITEAEDLDAVAFTIDGIDYEGSKSEKTVMVKSVNTRQASIEIPASVGYDGTDYQVSAIADGIFDGSSIAALVWDVEAALSNNAFSNASIGSNFLLYVKSSSYAPSSVKNVVVNGTAQTIVLSDDGGQFYCPQAFTARSISYTHNYSMETSIGKAKGWETLALPFDVQKISHSSRGELVPFPYYNSSSNQKPFWLANFSGSDFRRTAAVLANEPYIIAMPNSSSYRNDYNLAGDVTFSADNVQVPKTPSFSGSFVPAFTTVERSSAVYALNVNNRYVKYSGSYDAGSYFISGLRDIRPFEAYMTGSPSRGIIEINFDNGLMDMLEILLSTDDSQEVIHTLNGQQVARTTQRDFNAFWQQLPKGVYIVNGKKMIK